jgi:hypothetical protein
MYHARTQDRNPAEEDGLSMSDDTTKNLPDGDRIDALVGLVQTMSVTLEYIKTDLRDVKARVEILEKTVSERLFDTRPIWERALAEMAETRSEMRDSFSKFDRKIDLLIEDVFAVRAENKSLGRRVDKLESNSS